MAFHRSVSNSTREEQTHHACRRFLTLSYAAQTPENANSLLKWHAKVLERAGPGGIVRAMTDRKTV